MNNQIIKGLTLVMFCSLIIAFVAYRSDFFNAKKITYSLSPNESALKTQTDSLSRIDSLKTLNMTSSSKDFNLRDHSVQIEDSIALIIDTAIKINPLMFSSKSGIILNPQDLKFIEPLSTKKDSLIKE